MDEAKVVAWFAKVRADERDRNEMTDPEVISLIRDLPATDDS
jgi:hypothetical protein